MTALGRVSRTGYYCTTVEKISESDGYLATARNLIDLSAGFTIGTSTPTATGTASLRGRVAVNGLAKSILTLDTVDGLAELMFDLVYPYAGGAYSIFQMDMNGNAGLQAQEPFGQTMDYPGAARVIRSNGTIASRCYFEHTPGSTSQISGKVLQHSSPSQYVLCVGQGTHGKDNDSPSTYVELENSGYLGSGYKYGYGFGIRSSASTTVREFVCQKELDNTTSCPTFNCFSGNLAPLTALSIAGTTRALGLEPGTVQDSWPGDGTYSLWQASQTLWKYIASPGSNPFGASPGFITVQVVPNGSNWDILVLTGGGNRRFEKINVAGGQNGMSGSISTTATAYQTATDGGGSCSIVFGS